MRSEIILYQIEDDREDVIHRTNELIEAPNWSPDGKFLIVNANGLIFRLNLDDPTALHHVDTHPIVHCNNDHGISPDGTKLVISDSPGRGTSLIYTLPITGGTPTLVTPNAPSYWHGWSPDGHTLTYTARRDGVFQICTIPVNGGDETILTRGKGHRDGPDYSADGQWIWFNSDHHGRTPDLWRMRTDGSGLEQMTDDALVNWFPHPSPDGKWVLFLAYPSDTEGHPRDTDVALRLMPQHGGPAKTIAEFNGGQGTMNVPNWAPSGKSFAYVRYTKP